MVADKANTTFSSFSFAPEKEHFSFYDFAVLVPHIFIDRTGKDELRIDSYGYSFTSNRKVI